MNVYLFLYPIREHFKEGIVGKRLQQFAEKGYNPKRLSEIIHTRYRAKGYQVWWLLFSASAQTPLIPDLNQVADEIEIRAQDTVITCGMPYADHVQREKYLDPDVALDQLPRETKKLVIGGFHQWNCVDNMAATAYSRGIPTVVDEDTTEHFFERTMLLGEIPLDCPLVDHVNDLSKKFETLSFEGRFFSSKIIQLKSRQRKPWFMQPN